MIKLNVLLSIIGIYIASLGVLADCTVNGMLTDESGQPLFNAEVVLYKAGEVNRRTITNMDGEFEFLGIESGSYNLTINYVGFSELKTENFYLDKFGHKSFNLSMERGAILDEIVISDYKLPLISFDNTTSGATISNQVVNSYEGRPESVYSKKVPILKDELPAKDIVEKQSVQSWATKDHSINSGTLTAGEWNELHQWENWLELLENEDYFGYLKRWNLDTYQRYPVIVMNQNYVPLPNVKLRLQNSKGDTLWTAVTDNTGRAELWSTEEHIFVSVESNSFKENPIEWDVDPSASMQIILPEACRQSKSLDIMFVIDATGSMDDEIDYLTVELRDVINRVEYGTKESVNFRLGTVFYKDHGDNFVFKKCSLDSDISKSIEFIKLIDVGGGGDTPEAVDVGLEHALNEDWDEHALNRILFLLLDAPPHGDNAIKLKLARQIRQAAARGIKIIPIVASGIDRPTEALMKQISILTNGTYVFLTDDSGVGKSHLDHIHPDYEVEKLNDLLVRLIEGYSAQPKCEPNQIKNETIDYKIYPNPAKHIVNIQLEEGIDQLILNSANGKKLMIKDQLDKGIHRFNVADLVAGMYILSGSRNGNIVFSNQIMVVN